MATLCIDMSDSQGMMFGLWASGCRLPEASAVVRAGSTARGRQSYHAAKFCIREDHQSAMPSEGSH